MQEEKANGKSKSFFPLWQTVNFRFCTDTVKLHLAADPCIFDPCTLPGTQERGFAEYLVDLF